MNKTSWKRVDTRSLDEVIKTDADKPAAGQKPTKEEFFLISMLLFLEEGIYIYSGNLIDIVETPIGTTKCVLCNVYKFTDANFTNIPFSSGWQRQFGIHKFYLIERKIKTTICTNLNIKSYGSKPGFKSNLRKSIQQSPEWD